MAGKRAGSTMLMTEGVIWKQLLLFSFPLLIGNLFQQLYNTVDSIVVGNFIGSQALAAVGSSNSLINLIIGMFMGIATGAGVIISQYYGAADEKKLSWAVHTCIALSLIGGVLLSILGVVLSPFILKWMGTPEDVIDNSVIYFRIFFSGSLFNLLYNMAAGILRAVGDSKRPLYYLCVSSVINIVLDLVFVVTFSMGIAGVGYATIIAQAVSAALAIWALMGTKDIYRVIAINQFILPDNLEPFFRQVFREVSSVSYMIDAIDTVSAKLAIAEYGWKHSIPLISSMGTGNKLRPELFEITDIYKTSVCPLCKVMRRELKKREIPCLDVLYSKEEPRKPLKAADTEEETASQTVRRSTPGSIAFVPPVAGLMIAGKVIRTLCGL